MTEFKTPSGPREEGPRYRSTIQKWLDHHHIPGPLPNSYVQCIVSIEQKGARVSWWWSIKWSQMIGYPRLSDSVNDGTSARAKMDCVHRLGTEKFVVFDKHSREENRGLTLSRVKAMAVHYCDWYCSIAANKSFIEVRSSLASSHSCHQVHARELAAGGQ